jgi:uncharacterized protein (TIGR00290 family)
MTSKKKVTISWSGGKDSAFALYKILTSGEFEVVNLHTVIDQDSKRVGLHGVRETLIEKQAAHIGLPLEKIYLPASDNHEVYKSTMQKFYHECAAREIDGVVFGDIFLEDLRDFRMALLQLSKLSAFFPLWKVDSKMLLNDFIDLGFKTTICSADANFFSPPNLGLLDPDFLDTVPSSVDPCGENGEFHTFVFDGPLFREHIAIAKGEIVKKTYSYQKKESNGEIKNIESSFWFQDYFLL